MSATRATRRTTGSESARQIHASSPSPAGTVLAPAGLVAQAAEQPPPDNLVTLAEAAATVEGNSSCGTGTRTRSGRVSKPPERYEPIEQVEDDYDADDYDTEDPDDVSEDIDTDTEDEEDDESDADEDGNLDGFVVPDKSESDVSDSDGEPPLPKATKRTPVIKKRTTT